MTVYYLVRDVEPGAICSYPRGLTLLNDSQVFTDQSSADRMAECYQSHCHIPGIRYSAVEWNESEPFPADHYAN